MKSQKKSGFQEVPVVMVGKDMISWGVSPTQEPKKKVAEEITYALEKWLHAMWWDLQVSGFQVL